MEKKHKNPPGNVCSMLPIMHRIKAINNGSACSLLFLSTTGWFLARRKIQQHETQCSNVFPSAGNNPGVLKTALSTLNHCLLLLNNSHKRHFSLPCISTDFEHV